MLDDKILNYFKKHEEGYVSGEDLSRELGISRAGVWKHIESLREEGYDIEAFPHLGYRLISIPDRLTEIELKWQLKTDIIARKIYSYKETSSTNDAAYQLAASGEKEGSVIIAESQTAGRGRMGRSWVSPRSKGAYFSVILRPDILPKEVSSITLFSALSVAKTIREMAGLAAFIKWPNDVLINNKKICGILTEMNAETDKINFVIIGIGININTKEEFLPKGATSIMEAKGAEISRVELVKGIFKNLDKYYRLFNGGHIAEIIREYKEFSNFLGKRAQVTYHDTKIEGYVVDVDKEGALILRMDSGLNERILAGDVTMLR
ncbi:MAG: biotin--[acetyl-CoA-carboxylase] ligase [Candidatus Omnitrophica bacterium CG_4_9_14_0_2_um_filter_42_8]|nr:MAG: biotin--[acetyl-CoA-carboxylase] ligase [Candidatus Omnitrophica bacterium CG22_combo_CG10-13_8_21_14_all_43_16]PJC48805.1 MAG: biotin--[acetyl-CoA-carboxylase] ligase [Candidatus Omnitrophica bacterium CG_4_9_14_0_2_um_filter_42_8]